MQECKGLTTAFGGETSKKLRHNDDADDNHGGDQSKRPVIQDPSKTVTTIFGGRPIFEEKREQKSVARHIMSVTTYDAPITNPKFLPWS
jgi:hypothetical protein